MDKYEATCEWEELSGIAKEEGVTLSVAPDDGRLDGYLADVGGFRQTFLTLDGVAGFLNGVSVGRRLT